MDDGRLDSDSSPSESSIAAELETILLPGLRHWCGLKPFGWQRRGSKIPTADLKKSGEAVRPRQLLHFTQLRQECNRCVKTVRSAGRSKVVYIASGSWRLIVARSFWVDSGVAPAMAEARGSKDELSSCRRLMPRRAVTGP